MSLMNSGILIARKIVIAGTVAFVFIGLLMGILGFILSGIMKFLPFLNWQILIVIILALGILINTFGSKKYSEKSSSGVIIARSIRRFTENIIEKNKDAFRADSVSVDDLFGITPLRDEMRENHKAIISSLITITEDEEIKDSLKKALQQIEYNEKNKKNCSARIYVLSASNDNKKKRNVLASSSPTPATGFIFQGVLDEWLHKENFLKVVHEITSGSLFSNQDKEEKK